MNGLNVICHLSFVTFGCVRDACSSEPHPIQQKGNYKSSALSLAFRPLLLYFCNRIRHGVVCGFFCLRMKADVVPCKPQEKHFYFDHSVRETGLPEKHFQSISNKQISKCRLKGDDSRGEVGGEIFEEKCAHVSTLLLSQSSDNEDYY